METASVTDSDGGASSDYRASERALTSVEALLEKDAHDESLRRYKEQLLGSAAHGDRGDTNDTRRVVVEEFKVVFEDGREDIVYNLDTLQGIEHMRTTPFVMEEGARYKFAVSFRVNKAIVSGLRFRNKVKKTVLSNIDEVVLGSYAPRSMPYEFVYPRHEWIDAPSGMFYRGKYMAQFRLIDDDKQEHIKNYYTFGECCVFTNDKLTE
ncbi:Rho gdp-dissociation inhibitor, partial [Globisporangium splendens]